MKRTAAILLVLALVFPATALADFVCYWTVTFMWAPEIGIYIPISWDMHCSETITVTPPYEPPIEQPPTGPEPPHPPTGGGQFPTVRIVSISDENPHQPRVQVEYNNVVTSVRLNAGNHSNTLAAPNTVFFLPSLNNFAGGATITVTAYDAAGVFSTAYGAIRRPQSTGRAANDLLLRYFLQMPGGELDDRLVRYDRGVATNFVVTDYDVPTVGERNGRVFHEQTEDAIFWNNTNIPFERDRTPFPSLLISRYVMFPSYMNGGPDDSFGQPCTATGLTRGMFSSYSYPDHAARCDYPAEFARDGQPGATYEIELDAGNTLIRGQTIGVTVLSVNP